MTELRDWMNGQGVKNTRGAPLNYNSIQRMLGNRRYIGEFSFREVIIPDGFPAIVPKDLFNRVQAKLEVNKKAPARHKAEDDYLLTTKLFCGCCGAYMCGESGTSHTDIVHHYYKCVNIEIRIANEKLAKPKVSAEFVTFWLQRFRKLDVTQQSHRKMLIDTFVSKIFLFDDKVVIGFNYKDGEQEISFGDVKTVVEQGAAGSDLDWSGAPNARKLLLSGVLASRKARRSWR